MENLSGRPPGRPKRRSVIESGLRLCAANLFCSGWDQMACFCENGNELCGSVLLGESVIFSTRFVFHRIGSVRWTRAGKGHVRVH